MDTLNSIISHNIAIEEEENYVTSDAHLFDSSLIASLISSVLVLFEVLDHVSPWW